ncbi:hypothetical protein UA08_00393 [Talaromyces atroroseus]|uniref:Uncharacterized protein n=1 Tax=Talaromyces atroroseus TaxID=1441469 RepID=A0A225ARQ5_TALAT|nr:hypothetical protein UA08_00393 [Talaromyces atroroseus]OKL64261.1 hypothetical protein UA08_00393 [Talaromyces atroroseus]
MPNDPADLQFAAEDVPGRDSGLGSLDTGTSVDPNTSVDVYNRVMLQYTQRQIAAFTQEDKGTGRRGSSTSGRSGQSNSSSVGNMARTGTCPPPQRSSEASASQSPGGPRA